MNILFITTFYPTPEYPQYGIFIHELAKELKNLGNYIEVINTVSNLEKDYEWDYEGIHIKYIGYKQFPTNYLSYPTSKKLSKTLMKLGKEYFDKFDVIHAHNCMPEGNAVRLLCKKLNKKYFIQIHGLDVYHNNYLKGNVFKRYYEKVCSNVYRDADKIIGVSGKVINNINGFEDKKYVVYNGYNPKVFNDDAKSIDEKNKIKIITVGNLIPIKGYIQLIEAIGKSKDKFNHEVEFNILGRGPLESTIKEMIVGLGLSDIIKLRGYVPADKVSEQMRQCDFFVLPSYYEALGCVYLEAMACGLPVIACREQGIEEILNDGVDSILCKPEDVETLSDALIELVNNDSKRENMASEAEKNIERYTWKDAAEKLNEIYND